MLRGSLENFAPRHSLTTVYALSIRLRHPSHDPCMLVTCAQSDLNEHQFRREILLDHRPQSFDVSEIAGWKSRQKMKAMTSSASETGLETEGRSADSPHERSICFANSGLQAVGTSPKVRGKKTSDFAESAVLSVASNQSFAKTDGLPPKFADQITAKCAQLDTVHTFS